MKAVFPSAELLEERIASASVLSYTDVGGDRVQITSVGTRSKGPSTDVHVLSQATGDVVVREVSAPV